MWSFKVAVITPIYLLGSQMLTAAKAVGDTSPSNQYPLFNITDWGDPEPPNCADMVTDTILYGDGAPQEWTYWERVSVSTSLR
jgi:hypothetical protein